MAALRLPSATVAGAAPRRAAVRPAMRAATRPVVLMRAAPSKNLDTQIQEALSTADDECNTKGVQSKDCEVAWDQAEELLAAKAHKKAKDAENSDPLESFCKDAPDADECRVHEI